MARTPREDRASVKESSITLRLTLSERDALNRLVALRQEELGADATVSQGSYMRALLREAARAKGIVVDESTGARAADLAASSKRPQKEKPPKAKAPSRGSKR
jgi:hypothetical protein